MAKGDAKPNTTELFSSRGAAYEWLKQEGYKVAKGTFYGDCKNGKLPLNKDGTLSRHKVSLYAQTKDVATEQVLSLSAQKEQLTVEKLQEEVNKAKREARKDDDRWLYRDEAYAQMAAFFGTLVDSLNHHFLTGMDEMVDTLDGNISLKEQGYELAEEIIGRACNEVCAMGQINRVLVKSTQ
jgi:molybdopterin converting factor small subunit